MKKTIIRYSLIVAAALVLPLANADTIRMEAANPGSQTGTMAQTLAQYTAKNGVDLQVILGQALTRSALKVAVGKIDSTFVVPSVIQAMANGAGPYASHASQAKTFAKNLRSIVGLPGGVFHAITWADSGIKSWDDVRGKRVYVGPPAGAAGPMITGMIEVSSGLKEDVDYQTVRAPWSTAMQAFQDGQFDVLVLSVPLGQQSINELSLQRPIRLLGIPADAIKTAQWKQYTAKNFTTYATIPAGTYEGQVNSDQDILASANLVYLAVNKDMSDDTAYKLAKSYWDNLKGIKDANALLRSIDTKDPFIGLNVPLHPGAARYFKEQGFDIPAQLVSK